jgi:type III restriction enzyme
MGAGKTILIGAVVATEFALALEYPEGPFVQNALVFAPGKTILESLRELSGIPYAKLLPPRLHKAFAASAKLTSTRDGERDLPIVRGSVFNVVITNTEKIRIQKETIRKADIGNLFAPERADEQRAEVANLRLQAIASLPHLAVFSDEAHHTYGQSLDAELKTVRKTVDYLGSNTNVVCVANTTGTPYHQRQLLRDVVIWYGLSEGIRDGILKELAGSIQSFEFSEDPRPYVRHVISDFFGKYDQVRLPNGAYAKLAMYFPQTEDLKELRPVIDEALIQAGYGPALSLVNTSDSKLTTTADIDAFNRLNDPAAPHRVMLLVNKGTEGWNCPSLFACALVRRLKTSNNFVLQAATGCLRQVPGNIHQARVYLSSDNYGVLAKQLQETYGESVETLNRSALEHRRERIVLRKVDIPPLVISKTVKKMARRKPPTALRLERPRRGHGPVLVAKTYTLGHQEATRSVLRQLGDSVVVEGSGPDTLDLRAAAVELCARHRVGLWEAYDELARAYGQDDVPVADLEAISEQIEKQLGEHETTEEQVDVALALVRFEGFERSEDDQGSAVYTAEITYRKDKEHLLLSWKSLAEENPHGLGFHYSPHDFDSAPEKSYLELLLKELSLDIRDVEDVFFTGSLTDPAKTDFFVEYKDEKGKWRRYTPDFVIRTKPPLGVPPVPARS